METLQNGIVQVRYQDGEGAKRDYFGVVRCSGEYAYFFEGIPFSNWWTSEPYIEYDGHRFTSSEHLFMYFKAVHFKDEVMAARIINAKSYRSAKMYGRKVTPYSDEEWGRVGEEYMHTALVAKYRSDSVFRDALMDKAYAGKTFVEASPFDRKWGIGLAATDEVVLGAKAWKGTNLLGRTLTRVRDEALAGEI